jgi:hypothetical protein
MWRRKRTRKLIMKRKGDSGIRDEEDNERKKKEVKRGRKIIREGRK